MSSIILSGPPAVGKTTVASALAGRFGLRYIGGGDVLKEMARERGFDPAGDDWWDTAEGMEFLKLRSKDPSFDRRVDEHLKSLFDSGGVVLTSYTLAWLVEGGIKVWLAGSHENSARRMQERDGIGRDEAYDVTKRRYERNRELYRELYGFEFGEGLDIFDVVIETDGLDASQVIERAVSEVRGRL